MLWGDCCCFWNRHWVRGWALVGTLPRRKVRGAPTVVSERRAQRGSANVRSHWFASTWGFLMLIVTYFLIFPYFRVSYSLTIIISYEWLLNSKGLSEHIWKGSGPDILFCEVRGEKEPGKWQWLVMTEEWALNFWNFLPLEKTFFSVGIRSLFLFILNDLPLQLVIQGQDNKCCIMAEIL